MIDSSVGGKTGVNTRSGKNLVGAFHQPSGVLIDTRVLETLAKREVNAGFYEAVKQGAIAGPDLLGQTAQFLELRRQRKADLRSQQLADLIKAQVEFKAVVVAGDGRESSSRTDAASRKILNFGHTLAHALEKVTNYRKLKHGEAVGYGILFAGELSKTLALCSEKDINLLYDVVHSVGTLPRLGDIDPDAVLAAFDQDKKNVSGSLQMILLEGIGKPVILAGDDLQPAIRKVLATLLKQWA
jgi:3-dehydroquinate synthase